MLSGFGEAFGLAVAGVAFTFAVGFLIALRFRDASVVDSAWGLAFVVGSWSAFALAGGAEWRKLLVCSLVTVWGLRLAAYLGWRRLKERREDPRYTDLLARRGGWRPLTVALHVFTLQAVLVSVVLLAPVAAEAARGGASVGDWIGAAVFAFGTAFEAVADLQLARFKGDPQNKGKVMDRGLWRYSRHPNYFGEFLCWWGAFGIAAGGGEAWWAVVSPLLMAVLLLRVSGKDHLERYLSSRPGYREYVARTSGFVPLPPKAQPR